MQVADSNIYMRTRIACVIPAFNREDTIGEALESVLNQTRKPDEIIVVDDGSTDATVTICQQYGKSVKVISKENGGASSARNRGAREAYSEWIAWLDSDDLWHEDYLEKVEEVIMATEGQAMLYFSNIELDNEQFKASKVWDHLNIDFSGNLYKMIENPSQFALEHHYMAMLQTSVMNKVAFEKVGGLDESLSVHEDLFLFLLFFINYPVCAVNQIGGTMRAGQSNRLSNSNLLRKHEDSLRMWEKLRFIHPALTKKWEKKCFSYESKALKRQAKCYFLNRDFITGFITILKAIVRKIRAIT